jgi:hypothetical protein
MHGSAWNWTSSRWKRGSDKSKRTRFTLRGGNGRDGELIGRCANGRGLRADKKDPHVGVRCCVGKINPAEVELSIERGRHFSYRPVDDALAAKLSALAPNAIHEAVESMPKSVQFKVERLWIWRPIGNEELVMGGGCAHPPLHDACGVVIARLDADGSPKLLSFVSSDWWIPTVSEHDEPRRLYVYGGDIGGAYRKPIVYAWGRIAEGGRYRKKRGGYQIDRRGAGD